MKKNTGIPRAAVAGLALCAVLLTGCTKSPSGTETTLTASSSTSQSDGNLSFVAADKSNWDKEVAIGDYQYTLAVNFAKDGTLTLTGTCTGRKQAEAQRGGPGGSGNSDEETTEATTQPELTDSEKAALNFTLTGTWTYDTGYGYTVTIGDYTTKTDYDKASARQVFYAQITANGATSDLIQFQGKDTAFRKEIAADYEDFEIRDAAFVFEYVQTGSNNNPNSTHLYLEKDGSANALTYQGSSPTYKRGSWKENADKSLTLTMDGKDYTADYCDVSGKEGYRITYNSDTMYASVSGAEISYTDEDFNGKTVMTLQCAEQDYTVALTEKGFAVVMKDGQVDSTGKYTEQDGVYTIVLGDDTFVSENGTITLEFADNSQMASSGGGDPETRTFALDGSVPAASEAPAGGEGAPDASSAGGDTAPSDGAPTEGGEGTPDASSGGDGAPSEGGEGAPDASSGGGQ